MDRLQTQGNSNVACNAWWSYRDWILHLGRAFDRRNRAFLSSGDTYTCFFKAYKGSNRIWRWNCYGNIRAFLEDRSAIIYRNDGICAGWYGSTGFTGRISEKGQFSNAIYSVFVRGIRNRHMGKIRRGDIMKRKCWKGSYTIEAAIYIPMILFLLYQSIGTAIDFWKDSRIREESSCLKELDIVQEFYGYQIMGEIGKELFDDES